MKRAKRPLGHVTDRPKGSGRWIIVISTRDPETGKRKRNWHRYPEERGKTATKTEAQKELARLLTNIENHTYVEPNKTTLAQYLDQWLATIKPTVSPKTYERYEQVCKKNIIPLMGAVRLARLKPAQISAAYVSALTSGRRNGKGGLSPRTVHHMHVILKGALQQAVKWDMLPKNPADNVEAPKADPKPMKTYDVEQAAELLEVVRGTCMFVPVLLAIQCGLRRGEIAALRWRHIEKAQLSVIESAEQTKAGVRYKPPKSGRTRTVALSASVVAALKARRVEQAQQLLKLGKRLSDNDFVVAQEDGAPLRPHSLGQQWVRFLADHKALPRIRFHDLRHTHATLMLKENVHPKIASERLGHSKVSVTLDLYSHVLPNMQTEAAAIVDGALQAALNQRQK